MANKRGIEAGRTYVKAWFDDSLVTRGLKRMRASIVSVSESLKNVGTKLVAGGVAVGALFAKPIRDAGRMEAVFASFETIFKGSSDAMGEWADELAKSLGRARTDVREFMTQTQGRLLAAGMDPAQAEEINKRLATRALDLAQFWDKEDEQAFRAMQNALTGEMEMLKQFGIVIHQADTDARLKAMGLDPRTASQAEKAHARFELMMQRSAETQGTAARESGEWSSLIKRLWAEVQTLSETIGNVLLPVVLPLMSQLADGVGRATAFAKSNGRLIFSVAATAAAVTVLGSALIALSVALRGAILAVSGLALLLRVALFPATVLVTAATTTLRAVTLSFAASCKAAVATTAALAGMIRSVAGIAGIAALVTEGLILVLTLFRAAAIKTRLALVALAVVTNTIEWTMRAAAVAVGVFGGALRLLAGTAAALGAAFAVLGNPVVAVVLAIGALAAGLYYAMQQGVTLGGVIDWLREKFGPLAQQVMEVFRVMSDALMAGEMAAAVKVLWAAIQLAFAHGAQWMRGLWIDLTEYLAGAFVDLGTAIESTWSQMLAAIISGLTATAQKALAVTAAVAEKLGLEDRAKALRALSVGVGVAGAMATGDAEGIESRRQQIRATLAEDAARRRAAIEGSTADEAAALEEAMHEAREATEAAKKELEAVPGVMTRDDLAPPPTTEAPDIASKASDAVNTAAIVGTQQGAEAFLKATQGFGRQVTPGEKMIGDKLDVIAKGIDGMVDKAVVIMEGHTA